MGLDERKYKNVIGQLPWHFPLFDVFAPVPVVNPVPVAVTVPIMAPVPVTARTFLELINRW